MGRYSVLVIGDDPFTKSLAQKIPDQGFQTIYSKNETEAINVLNNFDVDLIVLSHSLPLIDALEVLTKIKTLAGSIPIVFAAEMPTVDLVIAAFRAGATDFLHSPLEEQDLLNCLNRAITSFHSNEQDRSAISRPFFAFLKQQTQSLLWTATHIFDKTSIGNQLETSCNEEIKKPDSGFIQVYNSEPVVDKRLPERCTRIVEKDSLYENFTHQLKVCFLGKFKVIVNQKEIEHWPNRKAKKLFAYLAYYHNKRILKDILMDRFWPDSSANSARNCLYVDIHCIRHLLNELDPGNDYLIYKDECYFLNPEIDLWLDVEKFRYHWRLAQSIEHRTGIEAALPEYEHARSFYEGDFLEEELYENWPASERENLREIYLYILDKLSECHSANDRFNTAIKLCETILEKDNCREDVHRRLMICYHKTGRRSRAIKQFHKCVRCLKSELEVEPSSLTLRLYEKMKQNIKNSF